MTISIVTYPMTTEDGVSIAGDVELIKASLLYADKVELISFGASMIGAVSHLSEGGEAGLLELMSLLPDETLNSLSSKPIPVNWREMLAAMAAGVELGVITDPEAVEIVRDFEQSLTDASAHMSEVAEDLLESSGAAELIPCLDAGLLEITDAVGGEDFDSQVPPRWTRLIEQRLRDRRARLLFDDGSGDLVASMLAEGHLSSSELALRRIGKTAVGAGLVTRLPSFLSAPMDELLGLRADLRHTAVVS